jgi:hypothetical protein
MSERSERIIVTGSPRSGERLTGAPPVGLGGVHEAMVHQCERSERIIVTGSPRSGERLTGAPPVGLGGVHEAMVHQ